MDSGQCSNAGNLHDKANCDFCQYVVPVVLQAYPLLNYLTQCKVLSTGGEIDRRKRLMLTPFLRSKLRCSTIGGVVLGGTNSEEA